MAMQPPPSRYKVVERGRRLEVIDTHTGKPASTPPRLPLEGAPRLEHSGHKTGGGGATGGSAGIDPGGFRTSRWYDDKAPRTIRMSYTNRARLLNLRWGVAIAVALFVALGFLFWPAALLLIVALVTGPKLRAQLRAASTRFLDELDQAARASSSNG
jgi:hypothetical protein